MTAHWRNRIVGYSDEPPDQLLANPSNWRIHPGSQQAALAGALSEVGLVQNVIVNKTTGHVVDGHLRITLALRQGQPLIPVTWVELSEDEERYILATIDPLSAMATADAAALDALLSSVNSGDAAVQAMLAELAKEAGLYSEPMGEDPGAQIDKAEELREKWQTETGQMWQLGEHRVICGDCREPATWARLLDGEKANGVFTSPPYAEQRKEQYGGVPTAEYVAWWEAVQANARANLAADGSFFVNIKPNAEELDRNLYVFDLVLAMCRSWGWHFAEEFCWERAGIPQQVTRRFKNQFEPIYQFVTGKWKFRPDSVRHVSDRVPVALGKGAGDTNAARRQGKMSAIQGNAIGDGMAYPGNRLPTFQDVTQLLPHPAAFPVGLPSFFVRAFTDENDLVFDPFLGSGTTLIACEKLGRRCRGIEISPAYVAVTLQRWADMTGQTPELLVSS